MIRTHPVASPDKLTIGARGCNLFRSYFHRAELYRFINLDERVSRSRLNFEIQIYPDLYPPSLMHTIIVNSAAFPAEGKDTVRREPKVTKPDALITPPAKNNRRREGWPSIFPPRKRARARGRGWKEAWRRERNDRSSSGRR